MNEIVFPEDLVNSIKEGGIGIIPTDTMYGMVCSALNKNSVEKLFNIRQRDKNKPFLVLISGIEDLDTFGVSLGEDIKEILRKIWPGPVSVEMQVTSKDFEYLTRGTGRFAMRLPKNENLISLIKKTGPLVAPSTNPSGEKPAETLDEAWDYFPELDFFIDGGTLPNNSSTLVSIENGKLKVWRQGAWQVPEDLRI